MIIRGEKELIVALENISRQTQAKVGMAIAHVATYVRADAERNAPRSPTMEEKEKVRKTKRNTKNMKKASAFSRPIPGGLERSIEMEARVSAMEASIYVASNAKAGRYAARIHDEKGVSWHNRGIGTIMKGDRADEKFIERALNDNEERIRGAISRHAIR